MVHEHDFQKNPELRDSQMAELYFSSPHKQIFESFNARCIRVVDGDTISVEWQERDFPFKIRLAEIDARELSEEGQEAKDWVRSRIEGENIRVEIDKNNRVGKFGRLLGTIMHKGISINDELIRNGLALPFDQRNEGKIISPVKNIEGIVKWP